MPRKQPDDALGRMGDPLSALKTERKVILTSTKFGLISIISYPLEIFRGHRGYRGPEGCDTLREEIPGDAINLGLVLLIVFMIGEVEAEHSIRLELKEARGDDCTLEINDFAFRDICRVENASSIGREQERFLNELAIDAQTAIGKARWLHRKVSSINLASLERG